MKAANRGGVFLNITTTYAETGRCMQHAHQCAYSDVLVRCHDWWSCVHVATQVYVNLYVYVHICVCLCMCTRVRVLSLRIALSYTGLFLLFVRHVYACSVASFRDHHLVAVTYGHAVHSSSRRLPQRRV